MTRPDDPPVERRPLRRGFGGFLIDVVDPGLDGPFKPSRRDLESFALYVACAGLYVGIGLAEVNFLFSLWVAVAYLLITAWLVPVAVRRLR